MVYLCTSPNDTFLTMICHLILFRGILPESIGAGWSKLEYFSIDSNVFSGSLPAALANWTELIFFSAPNNKLSGTFSDSFGSWVNLLSFDVSAF